MSILNGRPLSQHSEIRNSLGLSQNAFARMLGVSVDTLQNWEQGRRKQAGAARVLMRIAAKHPKAVLEVAWKDLIRRSIVKNL